MPLLTIFREPFVNGLRQNIASNLERYKRDDRWITEVGTRSIRDLETRVELETLTLDEPDATNLKDLENTIRVHKALKHLTPLQARDPRIWTRLIHVDGWKYMRKRWPVERF